METLPLTLLDYKLMLYAKLLEIAPRELSSEDLDLSLKLSSNSEILAFIDKKSLDKKSK